MSETYRTKVSVVGGDVFLRLPDDQYIQMTPKQARAIAAHLFSKANEAEGKPSPEVVVFGGEA
ncbi:hypothetical protein QN084_06180 [Paenarthrobacter sp. R1]|uniref:hypothetical protein n=1 Tax=Paenarthrobacter sp. R1 TaxID=3049085 RepID=UPI002552711F|nr:hypothetical protein [Paenarthrobacter sp. R1]WIV32195.1 hypothetical protein QN084_06180 [Paenarthrobacter sp. R1]